MRACPNRTSILLGLSVAVMCSCSSNTTPSTQTQVDDAATLLNAEMFRQQFAKLGDEDREKRDLIIRAIDSGLIKVGMCATDFFALFGRTPRTEKYNESDPDISECIDLGKMVTPPPGSPPFVIGWYVVVHHDGTHVWGYYLSNAHAK